MHPYNTPRLEERFIYGDDGEMAPDESLATATRAEALIAIDTILNLNGTVLKGKREYLINEIVNTDTYTGLTPDEIFVAAGEFRSVINQYAP